MSPCDSIIDAPFTMPVGRHHVTAAWTPRNSDNKYRGMVTLKKAYVISTVSAKLMNKVGPEGRC
jgi:penicillin-binding protein 1A